jgi:hypothetical protein
MDRTLHQGRSLASPFRLRTICLSTFIDTIIDTNRDCGKLFVDIPESLDALIVGGTDQLPALRRENTMTHNTTSTDDSDEPVYNEETYQGLYHDAHHFAVISFNQSMSQLPDLGWSPVEIVERAIDYFDVEPDQGLLDEIAQIQAEQQDQPTEYSPKVVMSGDRGEPDFLGCPTVSDRDETAALNDGNEILTTEQNVAIEMGYGLCPMSRSTALQTSLARCRWAYISVALPDPSPRV